MLFGILKVSLSTFLLAVVFGLCVVTSVFVSQIALKIGPMTIYVMITSSGTMLNAVSGAIFWNEKLTWQKIVGMIGVLIMMLLIVGKNRGDKKVVARFLVIGSIFSLMATTAVFFIKSEKTDKIEHDSSSKEFATFAI